MNTTDVNTIWLVLAAACLLAAMAYWKQVYPRRPLVWAALIPVFASMLLVVAPQSFYGLMAVDALLVAIVTIDLTSLPRRGTFVAERRVGTIASIGQPHDVQLTISNLGRRGFQVWVRDRVGEFLTADPPQRDVALGGRSRVSLDYRLKAARRGAFELDAVSLRVRSRLGFWQRMFVCPAESRINVYPDMRQLEEYALLARTNRLSLMGMRRTRKIGGDNEFERLRDYTRDDHYKHIDWRATARRNRLTVRDFQANQSQRIIFLVDCDRMMTGEVEGLSLLDHALNAMLMLSFVALRQGDQVGMLAFSDRVQRYVPPRAGMNQTNHLLHASYDQFPQMVESRYDDAFLYLASHCRKRALVVLITNVIDEVNANQIHRYLTNLTGRHLPLGVLLRDHQLFDAAGTSITSDPALYQAAAAAEILTWRHQVLTDLEAQGVLMLDLFPERLAAPLVNQYLEIKGRHLL